MSYRIAIVDDNNADAEYVHSLLKAWAQDRQTSVQAEQFLSAESFLFHYAEDKAWDILLLDIEMGTMDGVMLAKKLRQEKDTVQIVFITGYADYIAEGYEVAALHYLMKPVKKDKLFSVLDRAVESLAKNETVLSFAVSGEMLRLPVYQIKYADVLGNYVTIHALENFKIKMTLGELEKQLDDRFFRVSRSVIVNLTQISRVTRTEIKLYDGASIPLPRGAYEAVNRAIIDLG